MPQSVPDATRLFYLLPGLGADERVFRALLPLLNGEVHALPGLLPERHETPHRITPSARPSGPLL